MSAIQDWLPNTVIGISFTALGVAKVYGFSRGIVGGACKPLGTRLCGSCPSWSRGANIAIVALFFLIGVFSLGSLLWSLMASGGPAR